MSTTQTPATATVTPPGLMKPRPYVRPEDTTDELPKVAVKDKKTFTQTEVEMIASQAADEAEERALNPEEATWKKRYSDLRRYQQEQAKKHSDEIAQLRQQVAKSVTKPELPKTAEEIKEWADEHPEVYALVKSIAVQENSQTLEALQQQIDALETRLQLTSQDKAEAQLTAMHPDWREINSDDAFHDWLKTRSKAIQNIVYNTFDVEAIADVLTNYKNTLGAPADKPKKAGKKPEVDAALSVAPSRGGGPGERTDEMIRESWIKSLRPEQFEEYQEMIDLAYAQGRIIRDVK